MEPEPGQSDGSGSSQIPRLRLRNPAFMIGSGSRRQLRPRRYFYQENCQTTCHTKIMTKISNFSPCKFSFKIIFLTVFLHHYWRVWIRIRIEFNKDPGSLSVWIPIRMITFADQHRYSFLSSLYLLVEEWEATAGCLTLREGKVRGKVEFAQPGQRSEGQGQGQHLHNHHNQLSQQVRVPPFKVKHNCRGTRKMLNLYHFNSIGATKVLFLFYAYLLFIFSKVVRWKWD